MKKIPAHKAINELYGIYVRNAKKRGRDMEFDSKEFLSLVTSNCHYCGRPPSLRFRPKRYEDFWYNGLDRKDNDKSYERGNCVSCCHICNKGKHTLSYSEWIEYLRDLVRFRISC